MSARHVPFSRCAIWQRQKAFFETEGVNAWNGQVPFYITSNPYLAHAYATLIFRFLQDCRQKTRGAASGPFYILELGAGTGTFSYYLLRRLMALKESSDVFVADFCYVMSDVSRKNLEFWQAHAALQPFVEQGVLDFARFDLDGDGTVTLEVSGTVLGAEPATTAQKPFVVIANYVFDAVPHDLYRVEEGRLLETLVPPALAAPPNQSANAALNLVTLLRDCEEREVAWPHYEQAALDGVLQGYLGLSGAGRFLFPVSALRGIARLRERVSPEILLLVADKGILHAGDRNEDGRLTVGLHGGCLSVTVDLEAVEHYARSEGGDCFHQASEGIITSLFTLGMELRSLPETRLALQQFMGTFNPGHLYDVLRYFDETRPRARLETLVALLELTLWDPFVFNRFFDVILASLPYAQPYAVHRLAENVQQIAGNFYFVPGATDSLFNLGMLLQEIRLYAEALEYYEASIYYFGRTDAALYNLGLCCYGLGRRDEALAWLRETVAMTPEHVKARGWISLLQEQSDTVHPSAISASSS
ncbi:MAG: SAM-dependent methyltransferase [Acidobacteria bacterium]|nr:SAM-dependent methyltransferase [Acidobacteriota bacterium]